jgi:hypothetical protein
MSAAVNIRFLLTIFKEGKGKDGPCNMPLEAGTEETEV